jgi:hypothetical protein
MALLIQKIKTKFESNIKVPYPKAIALGIGIGMSLMAVLALTAVDGGLFGEVQEVDAVRKFEEWN